MIRRHDQAESSGPDYYSSVLTLSRVGKLLEM